MIESVICTGCGCLCDDLDVTVEGDRVIEVANVCLWGVNKFIATKKFHSKKDRRRLLAPQVRRKGRAFDISYDAALEEAGKILIQARRPLVYGLTNNGSWAQEAALRLARRWQARLEPGDLAFMAPYYEALARHGLYWTPLEEIRDEADTILFWGANPIHSCPRHVVRYSVFSRGRFTERGAEERQIAAVDIYPTETAKFCKPFIQIDPGQELELLQGLAAYLIEGQEPPKRVKGTKKLVKLLSEASFGAIFVGRGVSYGPARKLWEGLARLVVWLNTRVPFSLFPLASDFNSVGLYHLLLRETGSPYAPDFGAASGLSSHPTPVDWREVDALLVTGADLFWFMSEDQVQALKERRVPIIVLSPFANRTTAKAQVVFPVALSGIETEEVAYRMDGLPVELQKLISTPLRPDHQVLADLEQILGGSTGG
ncbi:MAG: hypothetical protein DRG58_00030 [Deltaproteobacteria bacterium]|nr:MAG: hypothetical protein DRG58_00030 [Deltaproteobacteria bacterium]